MRTTAGRSKQPWIPLNRLVHEGRWEKCKEELQHLDRGNSNSAVASANTDAVVACLAPGKKGKVGCQAHKTRGKWPLPGGTMPRTGLVQGWLVLARCWGTARSLSILARTTSHRCPRPVSIRQVSLAVMGMASQGGILVVITPATCAESHLLYIVIE